MQILSQKLGKANAVTDEEKEWLRADHIQGCHPVRSWIEQQDDVKGLGYGDMLELGFSMMNME